MIYGLLITSMPKRAPDRHLTVVVSLAPKRFLLTPLPHFNLEGYVGKMAARALRLPGRAPDLRWADNA